MSRDNPAKPSTRARVLDAAEQLLVRGDAAFAMRALAEAAGVSFATPFNLFGGKPAIMLALSDRRIAAMRDRLAQTPRPDSAVAGVLHAVEVAASVMLAAPGVNRAVMAAIGAPGEAGGVSSRSAALWADALGTGAGLAVATRALALATLPGHLAIVFRGVLSFWTAGELVDDALTPCARAAAAAVLLGFAARAERAELRSAIGHER